MKTDVQGARHPGEVRFPLERDLRMWAWTRTGTTSWFSRFPISKKTLAFSTDQADRRGAVLRGRHCLEDSTSADRSGTTGSSGQSPGCLPRPWSVLLLQGGRGGSIPPRGSDCAAVRESGADVGGDRPASPALGGGIGEASQRSPEPRFFSGLGSIGEEPNRLLGHQTSMVTHALPNQHGRKALFMRKRSEFGRLRQEVSLNTEMARPQDQVGGSWTTTDGSATAVKALMAHASG